MPGQLVAIGVAASVVGLLAGCGAARSTVAAAAPLPDDLLGLLTGQADCGGAKLVLVRQHSWDFTGDGVADALVAVRCDTGAGSPPSAVFAVAAGGGGPRIVGELLRPADDEVVSELSGQGAQAVITAFAFGPNAPRCCPDLVAVHRYQWNGAGFDPGTRVATPLPTATADAG
ncbi:MAG TPA: hypothetical protein VHV82_04260 [Sporichthyaceae bacterium]|nr:hypothetical protein [Sporichthyaceae bacterium]